MQINRLKLNLDFFFFVLKKFLHNDDMVDDKMGFKNYDILIKTTTNNAGGFCYLRM